MKVFVGVSIIAAVILSSADCIAQCDDGRYSSEIFSGSTDTTVEYSDVYKDPGDTNQFLLMDIFQPENDIFTHRAVVIMAHGGTYIGGDRTEATCVQVCQMLAKRGYVTASIDYRLTGSQADLLDSTNAFRIALRTVSDMKAAVRYFRKDAANGNMYHIDPNQIFVGGNSAGAITSIHVAYVDDMGELPAYVQDIVIDNGGIDGNSGNPGYPSNVSGVINLAGGIHNVYWIEANDVPMVSCHGTNDGTVPYNCGNVLYPFLDALIDLCGSGAMKPRCDAVGTDNELHPYPGDDHVPWSAPNAPAKRDSMLAQVARFMKGHTSCELTGIRGIKEEAKFSIYPNPSEGLLNIDFNDYIDATVLIYDYLGQEVRKLRLNSATSAIDVSTLDEGCYLIRIYTSKGKSAVRTFIRN